MAKESHGGVMRAKRDRFATKFVACALGVGTLACVARPAHATFMIDPNPGGAMFFIDVANKDVGSFSGNVGGNGSGPVVNVSATGNVDTGSGFANVTPIRGSTLTSLVFTPTDPGQFSDFSFRAQLASAGFTGIVDVNVTDQSGTLFSLVFNGLAGPNADFGRIGVVSTDGETISSVQILTPGSESFKEVKQIEFSGAGSPVPEPESIMVLATGLLGLGMIWRRAGDNRRAAEKLQRARRRR